MKKYILSMGMIMAVFAFIAMLPLRASAAASAINVTEAEEGKASVKLTLPNAAQEGITTVSVSLAIDLKDAGAGAEELVPEIDFTEWIEGNTKVHTSRFQEGPVLNIYIAGTEPLFTADENGDILEVGTVCVKKADGSLAPFVINIEKSELKVVRGRNTVPITEEDMAGSSNDPETPGQPSGPGTQPGTTPEIEALRAELQALLERAEAIPAEDRTEDLQRAIDEAKRVLEDPNASMEELQAAITNLENALALFESNQNSGNNTVDSGKDVDTQNRRQNGTTVQGVKTGDANPVLPCVVAVVLSMMLSGGIFCRRRSKKQI